jgi:DNA polymerase III psi subunit
MTAMFSLRARSSIPANSNSTPKYNPFPASREKIYQLEDALAAKAAEGNDAIFTRTLEALMVSLTLHNSMVSMHLVTPLKDRHVASHREAKGFFLRHNSTQKSIRVICKQLIADAPLRAETNQTEVDDLCFLDEQQRARIFSALHAIKEHMHALRVIWQSMQAYEIDLYQ